MNSPTDPQSPKEQKSSKSSHKLPKKEDMANALRLAAEARELTEEERRYLFRELAQELLDPNAEELFTLCDNQGNVLGYFEPVLRHFRESGKQFVGTAKSKEDILEGSVSAREFIERVIHQRNAND